MDWELGNSNLGKRKAKPEINPQRSLRLSGKNQLKRRGAEVAKEWPRRSAALQKAEGGTYGTHGTYRSADFYVEREDERRLVFW